MQELQIQMTKVELAYPFVNAVEVTPQFIHSLPNAGAQLQKFGEQVEILNPGPVPKKVYATLGEYIIGFEDSNGKATYLVVSQVAYKSLFKEHSPSGMRVVSGSDAPGEEDSGDPLEDTLLSSPPQEPPHDPAQGNQGNPPLNLEKIHFPVKQETGNPPPATTNKPLTAEEKKAAEEDKKKKERLAHLEKLDIDALDTPIGKPAKE